jgi:hypothetical protein
VDRYAPPEPAAGAIDRGVQDLAARFPSASAFDAAMARSGVDSKRLRQTVRENLRIQQYLDQRFSVAPPSDDELGRYYRAHQATYTSGGQPTPFESARVQVAQDWTADRRKGLIDDWLAGLRRRGEILDLYGAGR